MNTLTFDLTKKAGVFKPMNAVNNGPCHKRHANDQARSNLATYKAARIPFARNHDASFCGSYGSEHTVDISAIFPNFDADPYDPASYDFPVTDEYILLRWKQERKPSTAWARKSSTTSKNMAPFLRRISKNGPLSVSTSSAITTRAGQTASI